MYLKLTQDTRKTGYQWLVAVAANDIIECWPSEMWYEAGEWSLCDPSVRCIVSISSAPHTCDAVFVSRALARGGFSATCTARGANNKIFSEHLEYFLQIFIREYYKYKIARVWNTEFRNRFRFFLVNKIKENCQPQPFSKPKSCIVIFVIWYFIEKS